MHILQADVQNVIVAGSTPTHQLTGRSVGECCEIAINNGQRFPGEIIGFRGSAVLSMALDKPTGIRYGDRVISTGNRPSIRVGESLLGRVIDATGTPIDGGRRPMSLSSDLLRDDALRSRD